MKRVYIIGAGTAVDAGIPASTGVFQKAKQIKDCFTSVKYSMPNNEARLLLERTSGLYDSIIGTLGRLEYEWSDPSEPRRNTKLLAELEGFIDFSKKPIEIKDSLYPEELVKKLIKLNDNGELGSNSYLIADIISIYFHVIFHCEREYFMNGKKQCSYDNIVDEFDREKDIIVSFNYDTILDKKLRDKSGITLLDYHIPGSTTCPTAWLYKPHKSLNWYQCDECGKIFLDWNMDQMPGNRINSSGHQITNTPCGHDTANPVLIPPSDLKNRDDFWRYGWKIDKGEMCAIERHLREADQVILSGYSLPAQDTYFNDVLYNSMANKRTTTTFYIFNNGIKGAWRVGEKLRNLLSKNNTGQPEWKIYLSRKNYGDKEDPRKDVISIEKAIEIHKVGEELEQEKHL